MKIKRWRDTWLKCLRKFSTRRISTLDLSVSLRIPSWSTPIQSRNRALLSRPLPQLLQAILKIKTSNTLIVLETLQLTGNYSSFILKATFTQDPKYPLIQNPSLNKNMRAPILRRKIVTNLTQAVTNPTPQNQQPESNTTAMQAKKRHRNEGL